MKFITRFIFLTIATYAGTTLLAPISVFGWNIDIGLLALVLISSYSNGGTTVAWGAYSGFLIDCLNPQWMGAGIVGRTTAALFLSAMHERSNIEHPFLDGIVILFAGIIDSSIYLALTQYRVSFLYGLWRYIIPSSIYTAIFAIVLVIIYRVRHLIKPRLV